MRWVALGFGLAVLFACAPASAHEASPHVHISGWPTDRLWSGAAADQACGPRMTPIAGDLQLAAPLRRAVFRRRGELIAELLAPRPLADSVVLTARTCATRAVGGASGETLLASAEPWGAFHAAFRACLKEEDAHPHVGGMTLWVEASCNW